jgi:hypothetical protein
LRKVQVMGGADEADAFREMPRRMLDPAKPFRVDSMQGPRND